MNSSHDIALLRLAAQGIARPEAASAAEAVRGLTALQAQDYPGAVTSIALRVKSGTRADVEAAMNAGEIVRSWPMRGTLHFVAAEDLPWMLDVAAGRILQGAARRREQLGLDAETIERARKLATDALSGGRDLRRDDLLAVWDEAGLLQTRGRGYHLILHLALSGTLCYGPTRDGEQRLVLADEWITSPRRLDREEALAEWALRFFRGHGPATLADFTRWTKLTATDAKAGLAGARSRLEKMTVDGVEHFMAPETPALLDACRDRARGVFLLPGFDEHMLGYQDRGAALPAEFADRIVPGGNGVFKPTVVADGQVVGTWKRTGRVKQPVAATPFTEFSREVEDAIPHLFAALP